MYVKEHPILGAAPDAGMVEVTILGKKYRVAKTRVIAAVMMENGLMVHRHTAKTGEPRGVYCGIGQCTDCVMIVDGKPNVRTCITAVEDGMIIEAQNGYGGEKRDA